MMNGSVGTFCTFDLEIVEPDEAREEAHSWKAIRANPPRISKQKKLNQSDANSSDQEVDDDAIKPYKKTFAKTKLASNSRIRVRSVREVRENKVLQSASPKIDRWLNVHAYVLLVVFLQHVIRTNQKQSDPASLDDEFNSVCIMHYAFGNSIIFIADLLLSRYLQHLNKVFCLMKLSTKRQ